MTLGSAAMLWALALPLAAHAAGRSDASVSPDSVFALFVYEIGSLICHQRPERSFRLLSVPLPVCARCTGIYVGAAVAAVLAIVPLGLLRRRPGPSAFAEALADRRSLGGGWSDPAGGGSERPALRPWLRVMSTTARTRVVLILAATPALLTLIFEWASGLTPSNDVRALTGVVLGAGVAWVLLRLE